ncbi:hypothetical protein L3X38_032527 [Prunus dulcis]|uniref:Uncharacterized protein n=1 Tax=Prunus dulcis TaxID=3755 RepID=A0AAD4YW01_PRUDU|nr:hypothetical protein L3X38_032527 [Prunus dulcis]
MNALPVESPATLRRQTAGPLEQAGTNGFEELGLGLRFRLVELSVSVRISVALSVVYGATCYDADLEDNYGGLLEIPSDMSEW